MQYLWREHMATNTWLRRQRVRVRQYQRDLINPVISVYSRAISGKKFSTAVAPKVSVATLRRGPESRVLLRVSKPKRSIFLQMLIRPFYECMRQIHANFNRFQHRWTAIERGPLLPCGSFLAGNVKSAHLVVATKDELVGRGQESAVKTTD